MTTPVTSYAVQTAGLVLSSSLLEQWQDAPALSSELYQPVVFGAVISRALAQPWGAARSVLAHLEISWSLFSPLQGVMLQPSPLLGTSPSVVLSQYWDMQSKTKIWGPLSVVWGLIDDTTIIENAPITAITITPVSDVGGAISGGIAGELDPISIELSGSIDQYTLSATIGVGTLAEYLACPVGSLLTLSTGGENFAFRVEGRSRNREHGSAVYTITALSPVAWLDAPYAETVTGEYSGMASSIATTLAAPVSISWETADWYIPPATLLAGSETPLALVRKIAAAVGAVLQSQPDGTLKVIPNYPLRVPDWGISTPAAILSDMDDIFTSSETYDHRPGYNHYIISDELTAADTVRLEEKEINAQRKQIRGYRTPWKPATIRHTGGSWVTINSMGVEEREETEVVEFVGGEGRTKYPIMDRLTMDWLEVSLGSVTSSEDGLLKADIAAESLLSITYRTRCHLWEATSPQIEQVQFVAEVVT
jgi:hypothetical protein